MDNNTDMNDLIKKAQEMIKNNQIPDEIKDIVSNMSSNSNNNECKSQTTTAKNIGTSNNQFSNVDMNKLMGIMSKLNSQPSDDDMSRLLFALKPYLRNEKKEKIDEYVRLIRMGKMAQLFDVLGGDKK